MAEADARRRAPRIKTGPRIYFSSDREEGPAVLVNISAVGALLEETGGKRPSVGEPVRMSVLLPNSPKRFQVVGKVSRQTQDGFAIEFDRPNPQIYELLVEDEASATRVAESGQQEGAAPEEADEGTGAAASKVKVSPLSRAELEKVLTDLERTLETAADTQRASAILMDALVKTIDHARRVRDALAKLSESLDSDP